MEKERFLQKLMVPQKRVQKGLSRYDSWAGREDKSQIEVLLSIRDSLAELTGGCEVSKFAEGLFCLKHGRPVETGEVRCDSFVRRRSYAGGEDPTKRQIEDYVRGVLGIKTGKNFRRLVDWWDGSRL
jgi:hypothetical protein